MNSEEQELHPFRIIDLNIKENYHISRFYLFSHDVKFENLP